MRISMHRFMMAPHKNVIALLCLSVPFLVGPLIIVQALGQANPHQATGSDPVLASPEWKLHESSGEALLDKASKCFSIALKSNRENCNPSQFLKQAGDEYGQLESLLAGTEGHVDAAAHLANGLVRSGLVARAIGFLMTRRETETDPVLSHLLADSLFAIGDFPNAAKAYRTWIN